MILLQLTEATAYPPAPHHLICGLIRDQYGTPILNSKAKVILETSSGVRLSAALSPGVEAAVNYQLKVPMDAGLTPDLYMPSALVAAAPFRVFVVINQTTNLPIQMTGDFSRLGKPGQRTHLDLTLGEDANGDGLPDQWELAFLTAIGSDLSLSELNANMVMTPDGLSLAQQFLLGNILFDPADFFTVTLIGFSGDSPCLEFTTMTGRSYSVFGSADLNEWTPLPFRVLAEGSNGPSHSFYFATNIRVLQIQVLQSTAGSPARFFRLLLQ